MSNDNVVSLCQPEPFHDALTALLREQAQGLIQCAVAEEFACFLLGARPQRRRRPSRDRAQRLPAAARDPDRYRAR